MTALKGMTWSHSRGYDPMVACSRLWREMTGVEVVWEKRSLQDFELFPVEELARQYDLIVIDHPHVGQITRENCLIPLDRADRAADLATLGRQSVGRSFESYRFAGHLWALPIDAATQVQAWRSDRISRPLAHWDEVMKLARSGRIACPFRPPHSLMVFYTLTANLGQACASEGPGPLIGAEHGEHVFDLMRALAETIDPVCYSMDPIAVYEKMSLADSSIACVPLTYGYVNYALAGFRPARIAFADIPVAGSLGPVGSALGGTGISVSARSAAIDAAADFAFWIASAGVQRGPYAAAGGQPGNAAAWEDAAVNTPTGGFYLNTRATLEGAWVRPRHYGYMEFQQRAAARIVEALQAKVASRIVVADLNRMFMASFD